jgi:hypothetical protein
MKKKLFIVQVHQDNVIMTAMNKERKPRDLIYRLKSPDTATEGYECDSRRMASLAREYHDKMQYKDLPKPRLPGEEDPNVTAVVCVTHASLVGVMLCGYQILSTRGTLLGTIPLER